MGLLLLAPLLSWHLTLLGFPGENYDQNNIWACCLWLASPSREFGGCSQQPPKPFVLRILPISPLLGTGCPLTLILGGMETCIWDKPTSSKTECQRYSGILASWFICLSAIEDHLWVPGLSGHSRQLVLMCIWCWDQSGARGALWAPLAIGPDVGLMLRIFCEHYLQFGHFYQLVLTFVYCADCLWALSDIWAFLSIGFWSLTTTENCLCWGMFVWDSVPVTLGEGLWQICHFVCECVFHLCDCYFCCLM